MSPSPTARPSSLAMPGTSGSPAVSTVRLRFSMTLLTDALPGAGSAPGETFDNTVRTDRFGLPFIPARTLKGLWLNAFREYLDVMGEEALTEGDLTLLFGTPGTEGCLRFGNGLPEGAQDLEAWLDGVPATHRPDPTRVKEAFVTRRSQTRIDPITGTAVQGTLHQAQYLRAGLVFTAEVTLQPHPDSVVQERLTSLLHPGEEGRSLLQSVLESDALRRFGTNRTRGAGAIACRLERLSPDVRAASGAPLPMPPSGARVRRTLRLTNPERLSIADNQPNGADCLPYLPGSLLLGAMAGAFRRVVPKSGEADACFRTLFLDGTCLFANAYRCDGNGHRSLPAPIGVFRTKDRRTDEKGRLVLSMERTADFCKALSGYVVPVPEQDGLLREVRPVLADALHVSLPGNRGFKGTGDAGMDGAVMDGSENGGTGVHGTLYGMRALESGQAFCSVIEGPPDCLSQLEALFPSGSVLQVGRSRGAQYGSVQVCWGDVEVLPEAVAEPVIPRGIRAEQSTNGLLESWKTCLLLLASPWIPGTMTEADDPGFVDPSNRTILRRDIADALGLPDDTIRLTDASVLRQAMTGGFHSFWGVPRPHLSAIAAGSTLVLQLPASCPLIPDTLWLGRQCQEGYGEAHLLPQAITRLEPEACGGARISWHGVPWHRVSNGIWDAAASNPFQRVVIAHVEDALRDAAIRDGRRHAATCRIPRPTTANRIRRFLATGDAGFAPEENAAPDDDHCPLPTSLGAFWQAVQQLQPKRGREFFFWFHRIPENATQWRLARETLYDIALGDILQRLDRIGFRNAMEAGELVRDTEETAANAAIAGWVPFANQLASRFQTLYLDTFLHEVYRNVKRGDA